MATTKHLVVASLAAGTIAITGGGAAVAAPSSSGHTLRFTSQATGTTTHFGRQFVNTDKEVKGGHTIGDDVVSGTVHPKANTISGTVAIALKGGQIYARFTGNLTNGKLTGKITGGAGTFTGIGGTITGTPVKQRQRRAPRRQIPLIDAAKGNRHRQSHRGRPFLRRCSARSMRVPSPPADQSPVATNAHVGNTQLREIRDPRHRTIDVGSRDPQHSFAGHSASASTGPYYELEGAVTGGQDRARQPCAVCARSARDRSSKPNLRPLKRCRSIFAVPVCSVTSDLAPAIKTNRRHVTACRSALGTLICLPPVTVGRCRAPILRSDRVDASADHPSGRRRCRHAIPRRAVLEPTDIEVAGEAADGPEALITLRALEPPPVPTVILLDNRMPGSTGLEVAADPGRPPRPADHPVQCLPQ